MIAGGVFSPGPGTSCLFSQFRGSTSSGCRPFDANADGVVFSEGAAVVVLRRMADAERLGLPIQAVVRGVGISSDGRSPAANVPQTRGQLLALERCYRHYGIDPASIQAIEGHGTSTPVGDSTEVETLRQFFSGRVEQPILLHSLKGLLGHAGWAAGTASIIAASQYLRNGVFPAQANHRQPSETLVRSAAALTVPAQARRLPPGRRRIAIDGFGFGGSNAHVVLENYAGPAQAPSQERGAAATAQEDELVCVAWHEAAPALSTENGLRFDRQRLALPKRPVLLPDLVDDMDISQKLAISLVDGIVAKLPRFDAALRRETSVLLALSGKTERGVGATLRSPPCAIASQARRARPRPRSADSRQRFREAFGAVHAAVHDAQRVVGPSRTATGSEWSEFRRRRRLELPGGRRDRSFFIAAHGDRDPTKLVIVTAIDANPWRVPRRGSPLPEHECAAAFAVTSRRHAEELGLTVIAPIEELLDASCHCADDEEPSTTTPQKVRKLLDRLRAPESAARLRPPNRTQLRRRQRNFQSMFPYGSKPLLKTAEPVRQTAMGRRSWRSSRRIKILWWRSPRRCPVTRDAARSSSLATPRRR